MRYHFAGTVVLMGRVHPVPERHMSARSTDARRGLRCRLRALVAVCCLTAAALPAGAIPAFPGAEGPGADATGGRGGDVYHVTNLQADNDGEIPGSLRYGLDTAPPQGRVIVFDVAGVIQLPPGATTTTWLRTGADNITVAGQTAPGPGITIIGGGTKWTGDNNIIRNLMIRPGPHQQNPGINTNDAFSLQLKNSIVDHVSATWADDENLSQTDSGFNTTVQYSLIAEGLNEYDHSFGSLLNTEVDDALMNFHHNLYAHNKSRNPRVGSETGAGAILNFSNNVVYDWEDRAAYSVADEVSRTNFLNNYFIAGPFNANNDRVFDGGGAMHEVYDEGNYGDMDRDLVHDGLPFQFIGNDYDPAAIEIDWLNESLAWIQGVHTDAHDPFPVDSGYLQSAQDAYTQVLSYVGANWAGRDAIDQRIIDTVVNRNGTVINMVSDVGGFPAYAMTQRPPDFDTDGDGMPDDWEVEHGLNPNVQDHNGDHDNDTYTNIEEYLNDLAAFPAPIVLEFNPAGGRYEEQANWSLDWQPSQYDEVQIVDGIVTVDSTGQHAGNIEIAAQPDDFAALNVTDGWLKVAGTLDITQGALGLSGGSLHTSVLDKEPLSAFNFTGGELHADVVTFDVLNEGGTIAPGNSIGMSHFMGDLEIDAGALQIELASDALADLLIVDGVLTLGGDLDVVLMDGYSPMVGNRWLIATAGQYAGAFDNVAEGYAVEQEGNDLYLVSLIPEPVALPLMLLAAPALLRRRAAR